MRYTERDLSCGHVLGAWQKQADVDRALHAQDVGHVLSVECPTCSERVSVVFLRVTRAEP